MQRLPPPPVRLGVSPAIRPSPLAAPEIVAVAHAEPLPPPRTVAPALKPGDEPPAPPKVLPTLLGAATSVGGPLGLDEVLDSVERSYPLLRAAEQERAIAGGRLVSAMGAFDLNLTAGVDGANARASPKFAWLIERL